ncbi:MAG: hypothetical protein NVSMB64_03010 [Candidatus Velthaea sp.]
MRDRSFADFMVGALACISVLGFYAVIRDADASVEEQRRLAEARWDLPRKRRRRRTPEDYCRHCGGNGACDACGPQSCRICRGSGLQPHDQSLLPRLSAMWDGIF